MSTENEQILISLEARHAENILKGIKLVELRRRSMNVNVGTTVWIYAKLPVGSIIGCASVMAVRVNSPLKLWRTFGALSGISRAEFFEYFDGIGEGTALELSDCKRLARSISLAALRRISVGFHPPQFFSRLRPGTPLLARFLEVVSAETDLGEAT